MNLVSTLPSKKTEQAAGMHQITGGEGNAPEMQNNETRILREKLKMRGRIDREGNEAGNKNKEKKGKDEEGPEAIDREGRNAG